MVCIGRAKSLIGVTLPLSKAYMIHHRIWTMWQITGEQLDGSASCVWNEPTQSKQMVIGCYLRLVTGFSSVLWGCTTEIHDVGFSKFLVNSPSKLYSYWIL